MLERKHSGQESRVDRQERPLRNGERAPRRVLKNPPATPSTPTPPRSRPQPHQHQLLQLVLPCLVPTLHRHTAIRVTMCPTSTRAGNTFPGGLVSIGPAHEWTVPGSAVRWGGVKGEEREGGGGVWCHSGVLVLQPSCR